MAEYALFRNLFIPQKDLQSFNQQAFRTDMQAIENWANNLNLSFDISVGNPIPSNVQPTFNLITFAGSASAGYYAYHFPVPYKYGYIALVCSAGATLADSMAVNQASSTAGTLEVYATLGGSPVTGTIIVVALVVGA
jgi:hypothetical protein